ncbi:MAG TPA: pyridoxal phosphate-dependent aminotransferase [Cytophagales bacterium]|jgi:dTDP-4-amino-4,6-dideoxygalactose transaminase|nr:pyridoxal phosphate-dependent aminotransferase [Cytophagales bacterium]
MNKRIYLSPPHLTGKEKEFINEALDSNWVAPAGPAIGHFESEIAKYNKIENALVVSSGTAAIHLALHVLGVSRGDEVICSTFTFSGSCYPILYQSATPVFVDSERKSWNMDPVLLEEAITDRLRHGSKPKAIIVVDLFGMPAQLNPMMEIARRYEIPVIEDAAEALGSKYYNKLAGTLGDIGIFSFNGNKIITTSGGGALVSQTKKWIDKARFLSSQSRSPVPYYQHEELGYNYQLSNISASIGLGQMLVLNERIQQRRAIFDFYKDHLPRHHFSFQPELEESVSNRWLTTVLIENSSFSPEELRVALEAKNIETRPLWKPMHLQPVFKNAPAYVNGVSESFFDKGLCLPSGSSLQSVDLDYITNSILEFISKR